MLPVFQKIEADFNHSFYVEHMKFKYFPNPLQFHPDIELLLVIRGTGTRIVGDSIERFSPGDLVLIGENVPHVWYSDKKYLRNDNDLSSEIIFVLFKKDAFGEQFWQLPESKSILDLLQLSQRGIKIGGRTRIPVSTFMKSICKASGFKRITLLFSMLEEIASGKEYQLLSSPTNQEIIDQYDSDRLNKVYKYIISNFQEDLPLEKAASIANLSPAVFCRYFKKRTNKTFIQFLNEVRIKHACRLLAEEDHSVASICYTCGYTSVSYFIKKFKEITGYTPLNYKKRVNDKLVIWS